MRDDSPSRVVTAMMGGGIVVLGAVLAASLSLLSPAQGGDDTHTASRPPAHVEPVTGTDVSRVTLTPRAVQRIGLETATVGTSGGDRRTRLVIPYAALLYDEEGSTWTYTAPGRRVFQRAPVAVDVIEGDRVWLSEGPEAGTRVVTVGAQELLGAEFGVGH
ncbi:hypothetical protein [Nocardioides iriomotensis]|uniref:Uncharacterized protein n=1 Tax=Nocardioides iriomotensis TaxID=715784 RepID=A0A4Q5J0H9_9ACTN|nr:hypothetical protein [Nocardioides iriomotensis]RYU12040.1 hypothetical protein ETU37_12365 [Nocardioides iriomotensis]